jgi:ribonuclease Z
MQITLTCFGTGDGVPSADRNHSAYLYTFGDTNILLDCGEPVSTSYKASGLSYDLIDAILISHLHSDHFSGLFMLIQSFWLEQRRKPLTIYLPADGIAPIRQMLHTAYLFPEALPFAITFVPLRPGGVGRSVPAEPQTSEITIGPVKVTPYRTTHLDQARQSYQAKYPGEYLACCFRLEAGGTSVAHTADLDAPEDLDPVLAQPLDFLVCEVAHAKPEVMFRYLAEKPVRRILFTHIARYEWERFAELQRTASAILAGENYSFARDGANIKIA